MYPDLLWGLVNSPTFMRLSLMKAAHAAVGWITRTGNPGGRLSVHGPDTMFFACFHSICHGVIGRVKALERASPIVFSPCTLGRTWGTRPGVKVLFSQTRQLAEGFSAASTTMAFTGPRIASSFSPICSSIALKRGGLVAASVAGGKPPPNCVSSGAHSRSKS
jgi:hypothetical protein